MTRRSQRGFTLVKVLVALVLMALISLVSWQGLDSVVRVRDHVERDAARNQAALNAIGQLATDISMRAADQSIQATLENSNPQPPSVLPLATTVQKRDNDAMLDVVRQPASGEAGWQAVRWWRAQGRLMRAVAPMGQDIPLPPPGPGLAVMEDVAAFEVRAYIPGQGWQSPPWQARSQRATGLALVITMAAPPGGTAQVYRRILDLL
jgi:general secretion pathway protein J